MKSLPQQPRQQAPNLLLLDWPALSQGPTPRQGLWLEIFQLLNYQFNFFNGYRIIQVFYFILIEF